MLIAPRGVRLRDVREVHSHPVALAQCRKFFARHKDVQPVAAYDTAGTAQPITEAGRPGAPRQARPRTPPGHERRIPARSSQESPRTFTRPLLVTRSAQP